ncbi:hypothetical protein HELRODRAFT_115447 [Helobdella robusta]|uniref:Uncharacterized protein n=1 Tax=Helobdella robusta TaxID=6412 RepID=T1EG82_HELRO|nr:hypothetical protein HELRODRAFT_115447 [Helobdella robusta]ESN93786.1 hypothetical protein HELRODRAFT_115447 [Helobdella robusta]
MEVLEGCLIQVVLSGKVSIEDLCAKQHVLYIHSYKSPHFCEFCGEMLWGLVKQGLKCEGPCGLNFHKRCVYKIRGDCMAFKPTSMKMINDDSTQQGRPSNGVSHLSSLSVQQSEMSVRRGSNLRLQIPHTFVSHNYTLPTQCQHCHKLLPIVGQSMQCKDCKINCHKKCQEYLPNNCQGETRAINEETDVEEDPCGNDSFEPQTALNDSPQQQRRQESCDVATAASAAASFNTPTAANVNNEMNNSGTAPTAAVSELRSVPSNNIPLQRVVQSFRNVKLTGVQSIRSDWMVWWTNHNPAKRHHYWTLDAKCITLYSEEKQKRYFKVIQLKDVTRLQLKKPNSSTANFSGDKKKTTTTTTTTTNNTANNNNNSVACEHIFEMVVGETIYCVGENWADERSDEKRERTILFENAIRQALLPLTPQSGGAGKETAKNSCQSEKITDINQRYEIFPEDVLGSGQFGIVYGARHLQKKHDVAIKVIDKAKFKDKQEAQLKNEVSILQNIDHPGVVNVEFVHESADKIYVVMEKLKGDMLEMILSSANSRLNERMTKFFVYQILMALKYLHDNNIVHCDLKPENVLLSSNSKFPQVKLCDFGFAKIIGEKSFRRSIVGTPAYLAPEVLKNKRYNRSLDMWSVGVILYVSLSGTFPFNEDEDISDQIQNAAFMFPKNLWGNISQQAIDLIVRILQVQLRNRFKVVDALNHAWMQDYQCWADLKALEKQVGMNYLTSKEDDNRWIEYARNKKLPSWQEIGHVEIPLNQIMASTFRSAF